MVTPPPIKKVEETPVKPVPEKKKKKSPLLRIVFLLLALALLGMGGIYAYNEVDHQIQQQAKEDDKERIRNNIDSYVTASNSAYNYSNWGGISGLEITVDNATDYLIDNARVKITYIKANGEIWQAKSFDFARISPRSSLTLRIPDTERGTSMQYEITSITSSSLGMY